MSVRILHAADLHLDSPFEALSGAQAAQRRREQRDLLRALPELARAHGAQIILLAGDLLDSGSPYPETAKALAETFAGCASEVFLAPGNHDYYSAGAPYARLTFPENVHIFRTAHRGRRAAGAGRARLGRGVYRQPLSRAAAGIFRAERAGDAGRFVYARGGGKSRLGV